jgi:hypothetical protein
MPHGMEFALTQRAVIGFRFGTSFGRDRFSGRDGPRAVPNLILIRRNRGEKRIELRIFVRGRLSHK